jgi:hypothetical protein
VTAAPGYGSDLVVDLLRAAGVEYVALNPGATYRGLHDSLVNYGGNRAPELILTTHEEIAVGLAHGYAKAKGAPMAAVVHDIVGLQHASMAVFNAFCDRAPVMVLGATGPMDATRRRPWIDWIHTALVQGTQVRDYVKLDDQPASLVALPESFLRSTCASTPGCRSRRSSGPSRCPTPRGSGRRRHRTPIRRRSRRPPAASPRRGSPSSSWSRSGAGRRRRRRCVASPS